MKRSRVPGAESTPGQSSLFTYALSHQMRCFREQAHWNRHRLWGQGREETTAESSEKKIRTKTFVTEEAKVGSGYS